MSTYKTDVTYKVTKEAKGKSKEMGALYFKNVPVTFACVLEPKPKYNSEDTAYSLNLFIDKKTMDKVTDIGLNKELAEVGVTKIKKGTNRGKIKFPLNDHNSPYEGMFAAQFTRDTVKRDSSGAFIRNNAPVKVISPDSKEFKENVGNGSICHVKMFAYRNEEDMLVVSLDTIVVLEHVPYENDGDYYDEELGVTIPSSKHSSGTNQEKTKEEPKEESKEEPEYDFSEDDDIPF